MSYHCDECDTDGAERFVCDGCVNVAVEDALADADADAEGTWRAELERVRDRAHGILVRAETGVTAADKAIEELRGLFPAI